MKLKYLLAASTVSLAAAAAVVPTSAFAQQITSGIEGRVVDDAGNAIVGSTIIVRDTRTGSENTLTAGADGYFRAENLVTGGPYTITATAPGFEGQSVEDVFINLQGNSQLTFTLDSGVDANTIVVTGARVQLTQRAIGPGQSFGEETIEAFPSITRDIRDIIRIDPRVSLDRSNEVDRVSCLGGNDRSNAFTVDGIAQSDLFGLNGTPFASRNSLPLPYDAVRETSVEFAPFDVQYGQFTGCSINVVTKSGQNEFHGSAFYTYADDSLRGETADGVNFSASPFEETRWGVSLGGPIIPDRLFFFGAYEKTDLADSQEFGPTGAGFPNSLDFVTEADFNRFSQILSDVYGFETGGLASSLPEGSERYFGRIDAYINDDHRLEATYQHLEETNVEPDDFSTSATSGVLTGINSFEDEGTKSDYYSVRLYSDWSDVFSTEVRVSHADVQDIQGPFGGGEAQSDNPIPRFVVGVTNGGNEGSIVAGPGFSRTSNELNTKVTQVKLLGRMDFDVHQITVGAEFNQLDVFNLFAQNSTGTLTFANLDDFAQGILTGGTNTFPAGADIVNGSAAGAYGNFTASGDINDAAANWKRNTWVAYVQDEWQVSSQLDVVAGVRVEWLSGDAPAANPAFFDRYGFTNANSFGKIDPVVLPRLGATYAFDNDGFFSNTVVKGGVGRFTGGDPAVYFSNAFSNNGFAVGFGQTGSGGCFTGGAQADVVQGGTFTGIPQCVVANAATNSAGGLADTQSTDPNFKQPTVWRANFGLSTDFGTPTGFFSDWRLNLDFIYSRFVNPADFVDLSQVVDPSQGLNGFTIDGRPIYRSIDPTRAGCNAQLQNQGGVPPTYTNVSAACFGTGRDDEIQLTNGDSYESKIFSAIVSKYWTRGLLTDGGSVRFNLGYAYTDAENNRYNNSSTATSSYDIVAAFDRQNVDVATAEYESRHNFTAALNFSETFFGNYATSLGAIFIARSGRPYSIVFDSIPSNPGTVFNDGASGDFNSLFYVPTGINDPNVVFGSAQTAADIEAFVAANDCVSQYRGTVLPRNSCRNDWYYDLDLRFSQELPGPMSAFGFREDSIRLFVDFDNFLNLIDSDSNVLKTYGYTEGVVRANLIDSQGRYTYASFLGLRDPVVQSSSSLWRIQLGVSYEF